MHHDQSGRIGFFNITTIKMTSKNNSSTPLFKNHNKPITDLRLNGDFISDAPKWYAVYTKSRFEKKIYWALQNSGFKAFLPLIREKRIWSDRVKSVQVPLLPSYVFLKIAKAHFSHIYLYPGFVRFVYFNGKPSEIKEEEICLMEEIITHGFPVQNTTCCGAGDWVRIVRGPLKGWKGRVEERIGQSRVRFQFDSIQQAISVEVEVSNVEKI